MGGLLLYFHFSCIPFTARQAGNIILTAAVGSLRSLFVPVMSRLLSLTLNYELDFPYCSETQHAICSYSRCGRKDYTDDTDMSPVDGGVDSSLPYLRLYFPPAPSGLCQPSQSL